METKYEVYEDNAGGLYLCIMSEEGKCIRIYDGWEYGYPGNLLKAIRKLQEYQEGYEDWGPDMSEKIEEGANALGLQPESREVIYGKLGTLIAYAQYDGNLWLNEHMGIAGRKSLWGEE